jgi:hypothetical protein
MSRFQVRGFVSILLSLAFVVVVATGLVLWLAHTPQTLGIGKGVWKHIHIVVSLLLLIAGAVHLWLNWSIYWSYLWDRTTRRSNQKRELGLAVAIMVALAGTAALDDHGGMSPLAKMSVKEVAAMARQTTEGFVSSLEKEGIAVHDPADSLLEIAEHNNVSPERLFAVVERQAPGLMRRPH